MVNLHVQLLAYVSPKRTSSKLMKTLGQAHAKYSLPLKLPWQTTAVKHLRNTRITQNKNWYWLQLIAPLSLLFQGRDEHCCPSNSFCITSFDQELHRDRPGLRIPQNKEVRPEKQQGNYTISMSGLVSVHWLAKPVQPG